MTVVNRENAELRDAIELRKRNRKGFTVTNVGPHVFSDQIVRDKAVAGEALTVSRKKKGKGKKVQSDDQEAEGDERTGFDGVELGLMDLVTF